MPDQFDTDLIEYTVENEVVVAEPKIEQVVTVVNNSDYIEVEIVEGSGTDLLTVDSDTEVQLYSGDLYFKDIDQDLLTGVVRKTDFIITTDDRRTFNLSSEARNLLHVFVNQIDYFAFCEITPPGSGQVVYTPGPGGYLLEVGDRVVIYWTP